MHAIDPVPFENQRSNFFQHVRVQMISKTIEAYIIPSSFKRLLLKKEKFSVINKQSLLVLALGIGLLTGCKSGPQNVQPGQQPEMQIEPFVEVTYKICEKGQKDGCKQSSISKFPPVKDIAIKQVKLDCSSAAKSMLFIKSRSCAGTYFTPQKEGYYLL